jgi:hypothetical protein
MGTKKVGKEEEEELVQNSAASLMGVVEDVQSTTGI